MTYVLATDVWAFGILLWVKSKQIDPRMCSKTPVVVCTVSFKRGDGAPCPCPLGKAQLCYLLIVLTCLLKSISILDPL